ncbi:MAG: hypothetical protein Q9P01_01620 [Anaerolineae bacterium]|nr:hypothetical protein [Anaerolineae bacterium]MDQ7033560.1 hypothetical protein [Anaerolineae bacterium]
MAVSSTNSSSSGSTTDTSGEKAEKEADFIKKVGERVWQLLQQDLRRDQERRGKRFGS